MARQSAVALHEYLSASAEERTNLLARAEAAEAWRREASWTLDALAIFLQIMGAEHRVDWREWIAMGVERWRTAEAQNLALIERLESLQFENLKLREGCVCQNGCKCGECNAYRAALANESHQNPDSGGHEWPQWTAGEAVEAHGCRGVVDDAWYDQVRVEWPDGTTDVYDTREVHRVPAQQDEDVIGTENLGIGFHRK